MVTLTIKLPEALKTRLEREAQQSGRSISAIIRELVNKKLPSAPAGSSLFDRTSDLCGRGASGRHDLATNPAHFTGFGE